MRAADSRPTVVFLFATVFIDSVGIGIIFPVMPDLLREVTGGGLSQAALWGGVLATGYAVMQFLCGPVVGNLSDRFGRRPVMLAALGVMAVDYVIMALAGSVWLLLAGRLVAGMTAATHVTANAYIADITPPSDRARRFGMIGAAFGAGFVAGPLLGGLLAGIDIRAPFWAAAAMAAANLALGLWVLPETATDRIRRPFSWRRANPLASFAAIGRLPGLGRLLALQFVYTVALTVYPAVWSYYGAAQFGWNATLIGVSLALYGVAMTAVQALAIGPAIRRWGERRSAFYGMLVDIVAYIFYGIATSGFWAMVFTPVAALGGIVDPAVRGIMSAAAPDDAQGELQGVVSSISAVGMGLSPLLMTGVFSWFTRPDAAIHAPGAPFLVSALLMVACVAILVAPPRAARPARPLG